MNVVELQVAGYLPGELTFELTRKDQSLEEQTHTDLTVEELGADPSLFTQLLPLTLNRALQQWVYDDPTPGLLAVASSERHLDSIPWEHLPGVLQLPTVFVARLSVQTEPVVDRPAQAPLTLLAAGWSGRPVLNLPGIQKELNAISQLGVATDMRVRVLSEPSLGEFADACSSIQPCALHLVPASVRSRNGMPLLALSGGENLQWVAIDQFLSSMPGNVQPRLAVLNTCSSGEGDGGPSATRVVTEQLGAVTVGWIGKIDDLAAYDFALFFYTRVLEGATVVDALRAYGSLQVSQRRVEQATRDARRRPRKRYATTPVVWAPSLALLSEPLLTRREEAERAGERRARAKGGPPSPRFTPSTRTAEPSIATLEVDFEPQKWLNPALLKNGWPAIVRLALNPDRELHNAGLAIACDTGSGTSTVRQTLNLNQGPQPIPIDTVQFPVLYELIEASIPRRQINFTVTCTHAGAVLAETTRSVLWMGRAEWLDQSETWPFIPAFVDPYADGVLDVIDVADGVLKKMVSPTSAFSGYQDEEAGFVVKQAAAIFNCLRDDPFQLKYINPPPIPVYTPGGQFASGQNVRTPGEVVDRHRGTCHDLAILFASCLEHIGIYPLLLLIQAHTFVGFWKDATKHEEFWRRARENDERLPGRPGREWIITDLEELRRLEQQDAVCFLEATWVTDRNASFEDAQKKGSEKLARSQDPKEWFDAAIDVQASRSSIQPL